MNTHYIYAWLDPRKPGRFVYDDGLLEFDYEPFYIGKGTRRRMFCERRNPYFNKKLSKIRVNRKEPIKIKIFDGLTSKEALCWEKELIEEIGIPNLTNLVEGGIGHALTDEIKKKIALGRLGKKHSEESKQKMSETKRANPRLRTIEERQRQSEKLKGRLLSDEWKRKIAESKIGDKNPNWRGKSVTEETRRKHSLRNNGENNPFYGKEHSNEVKQHLSESGKRWVGEFNHFYGKEHTEETKNKLSNHFRCLWELIDIENKKYVVDHLEKFCKERNLIYSNMRKVACGIIPDYKGWKIRKLKGYRENLEEEQSK